MRNNNRKTTHVLAAICCCLLLAACGNESAAKKATLGVLNDPDSAKFGSFYQDGDRACLTVNARNAMGGYGGNQEVSLKKINSVWNVLELTDISHESCMQAIASEKSQSKFCANLKETIENSNGDPKLKELSQKLYALENCSN